MKLIDTLSEDEEKKLIKKAKLIFSILKKRTITRRDGVSFSYELKDNMVPKVVKGEVEISAFITEIIERTYCPINEHAMKDLIIDKFNHFNINANLYYTSNSHVEKYKGKKPWEEQTELNESKENKFFKKGKAVYTALKSGKINYHQFGEDNEPARLTYTLSDERDIFTSEEGRIWITPKEIKVREENEECLRISAERVQYLIKEKFKSFNIGLNLRNFNTSSWDTWLNREGLNESNEDKEKLIKKVKTIYKAIKYGVLGKGHFGKITYELPHDYDVQIDVNDEAFVKVGRNGSNNDVKFFHVNDTSGEVRPYSLTNKEYESFIESIERRKFKPFNIVLWYEPNEWMLFDNPDENLNQHINENNEDKLIKKGKLLFKLYNKGTIGSKDKPDEPRFSYELSDNMSVGTLSGGEIVIFTDKVKIVELNRACRHTSALFMGSLIKKRFEQFGIVLSYPHIDKEDVDTHLEREGPLNEALMRYTEDDLTDKDRKKVKLIYDLFKTGRYIDDDTKYEYVLPDEYYVSIDDETGMPVVVLTMNPNQTLDLYMVLTNTYIPKVDKEYNNLYKDVKRRIKEKFNNFNIDIIF